MSTEPVVYFSGKDLSFIPAAWKEDGTYKDIGWPKDAVALDSATASKYWKQQAPSGKMLGSTASGGPCWIDIPSPAPPTSEEVDALRKRAYADPLTGCDAMFAESSRMDVMGEPGFEEVRTRAIARFEEIQVQYPWPAK